MNTPTIVSIQVGRPQTLSVPGSEEPEDQPWTTASFKTPVTGPLWLGKTNLAGDEQADLKNHGGSDKAVCVYSADHFPAWAAELGRPLPPPGCFSENFTVTDMVEGAVNIGDVYAVGDAIVQVSQPRQPCWKVARRWNEEDMVAFVVDSGRTGWYFRVLQEGEVAPGMELRLVERPMPDWSVTRANGVMYSRRKDPALAELVASPLLSASWRSMLRRRLK